MSNFVNIRPVGAELSHTDGQKDITEAKSANYLESHAWFTTSAGIPRAQRHKNSDRQFSRSQSPRVTDGQTNGLRLHMTPCL